MSKLVLSYLALGLAILGELAGTACLQRSAQFTKLWPTVGMLAGYTLSFNFLSHALKMIPLGVAYAIWGGVGIVLTALIGLWFFKQKLDTAAVLGIGLIIAGVVIVRLFSRSGVHG